MESNLENPTVWQYTGRIHIYPSGGGIELLNEPGNFLRKEIARALTGEPDGEGVFEVEMTVKSRLVEQERATE